MTPDLVSKILDAAEGVDKKDGAFGVADNHELTFYVGAPGRAMGISDVVRVELSDGYLRLVTRDKHTSFYVEFEAIHALSLKPPRGGDDDRRRAGFA